MYWKLLKYMYLRYLFLQKIMTTISDNLLVYLNLIKIQLFIILSFYYRMKI